MRCEEVQKVLATDVATRALRDTVESHVAGCPVCQHARLVFERIDETLKAGPVWEPPAGFADKVAARAGSLLPTRMEKSRLFSPGVLNALIPGVLVAAAGAVAGWLDPTALSAGLAAALEAYEQFVRGMSEPLVDHAVPLAWAFAGLSLWAARWFTVRASS